ncbi:unnamed protein product [Mytilus coruscus]|uniref:CCHC-type domain-containing protein n=1 Tax=Mytilus coruscus TaxID=42192 RepID=A0A6J8C7K6_MYTCO|nr:unnamed protein product [Mytilus coruscus]
MSTTRLKQYIRDQPHKPCNKEKYRTPILVSDSKGFTLRYHSPDIFVNETTEEDPFEDISTASNNSKSESKEAVDITDKCYGCNQKDPPKEISRNKKVVWLSCDICNNKNENRFTQSILIIDNILVEDKTALRDSRNIRKELNKIPLLVNKVESAYSLPHGGIAIHLKDKKDSQNIVDNWATENLETDSRENFEPDRKSKVTRCFNCNRLGHIARICAHKYTCSNCAKEECNLRQCPSSPKCDNCSRDHPLTSARCPKYQQILKRLEIQRIPTAEVRQDKNPSY